MSLARVLFCAVLLAASNGHADPAAWRVTGTDGSEVTLLGSMHVLRERDHPLPAAVDALIDRANVIVMEIDLDDLNPAAQQGLILRTAVLGEGRKLGEVLDAEAYGRVALRSRELGVDIALLESFEPWFVAITLLEIGMRKHGFAGERGVEQYVLARARNRGTEIVGLETIDFQIGIFDSLAPPLQELMLEQTLAELDEADTAMARMADAWRAGQLAELSEELLDDFADFPGLYATLVTKRNEVWLEALERLLDDGQRYLVVVGALHLVGPDNVVDGLAARGHRIERIH